MSGYKFNDYGKRWFSYFKSPKDLFDAFKKAYADKEAKKYFVADTDTGYERLINSQTIEDAIPATYPNFNNLNAYIEKFNEYSAKIDSGGAFEKQRLKLSEDKRFLFSFSLASKGLVRVPEYFSEDIAKKFPTMFNSVGKQATDETMVAGVVDVNLVQNFPMPNGKQFFFIKINGVEYSLRQQQKGTAKMLQINPSAKLVEGEDGMFYTDPSTFGDFSLTFSSSFKKSYIEIPKSGGKGRYVDLYLPFDMANSDLDRRLTSCVPLLLAAKYFQEARIKTRINIMRPILTQGKLTSSIVSIVVKDFNDPIDFNKLAVLRGIFNPVGRVITEANGFIQNVEDRNRGVVPQKENIYIYDAYADVLMYDDEYLLQSEFARYKNWFRNEVKEGNIKSQLVDKPLMLTFSTEGVLNAEINKLINDPKGYTANKVRNNFFEILDTVDLYYNQNVGKVVKRIKERFEKNKLEGFENPRDFKDYMIYLAGKLYRDFEPTIGTYASTQEEIDEATKKYNILLKKFKVEFEKLGVL